MAPPACPQYGMSLGLSELESEPEDENASNFHKEMLIAQKRVSRDEDNC